MKRFQKVNSNSQLSGTIRNQPEDFQVDEIQSFKPSGKGEHVWLHIKKTGENTDWVAGQLAKIADVMRRDVSFAGMKDRNAVTTQWFSVWMPGRDAPRWQDSLPETVQIIDEKRHNRKLRRGALVGNQFKIVITDFKGDQSELEKSIQRIHSEGIPNYFGEQRFGFFQEKQNEYLNILKAEQWFQGDFKVKGRQKKSIYLSAARSWLFNHILSERVKNGTWNKALAGDVFMLDGTKSSFLEDVDDVIKERIESKDIHPTGALWGRGRLASKDMVAELEQGVGNLFSNLVDGLENNGLQQERKALRLVVKDLKYQVDSDKPDVVTLKFSLPAGAYATSVLSEIGDFIS